MLITEDISNTKPPHINKNRRALFSKNYGVLTEIYQDDVNIAVWQRELSNKITQCSQQLLAQIPHLKAVMAVTPSNAYESLVEHLGEFEGNHEVCQEISLLVDLFCTLFELERAGLRLTALDRAMCPKFHVDKVPCRLVTTFTGITTQWVANSVVERAKLGAGSNGLPDETSGVIPDVSHINQLSVGDVALLKGEGWFENEGGGLVHRSPKPENGDQRLLLTLDFID